MTTNPIDKKRFPPGHRDVKAQYIHHVALKPPPEVSHTIPKHKDLKQRCIKIAVVSVISLLLLLLLAGILLAYYFSSSCVHGVQCGDGSCVWESQWCDGVAHCPSGQDEANCVRVHGSTFLLQIYSTKLKGWRTVCSYDWTDQYGKSSCRNMGYSRGTYFLSGQQVTASDNGFLMVKSAFNPHVSILQQVAFSKTCPHNEGVTLQCTDCGRGVNSSRALGGSTASPTSWPWQVSLQLAGSHRCGGAIISPYWIVTVAHCVSRPGDWTVYAGIVDSLGTLFNPAHTVSRVIAHEGYDSLTHNSDVALMKLSEPLDFTDSSKVGPVCLPNVGLNVTVCHNCRITWFGRVMNGDTVSLRLKESQVSLVDTAECNSSDAYNGQISQAMFCAREKDTGDSMCHADSGGPLVSLRDGLWWLLGDSIHGQHCTGQNKPGVYGNISHTLSWIYLQMKKHQDD